MLHWIADVRIFGTLGALFVTFSAAGVARAEPLAGPLAPPERREQRLWRREWPTFSWVEGVATVAAGAGTLVLALNPPPAEPRWRGGILFDDAIRDSLRLDSESARQATRSAGDWPYYTAGLLPLIADPLVALWAHGDKKAALNLELMALEAFSYAGLLSFVSTRASVRERPDSAECRRSSSDPESCPSDTESFWSGHSSMAAASAGIVCANHRAMRLWSNPVADASACALASAGALFTGVSRVAADRHYATDVLLGLGVGFGVGYAVPTLLHYGRGPSRVNVTVRPGGLGGGAVLTVAGLL